MVVKKVTCPRCGGDTRRVSGFTKCINIKCEYVLGSALNDTDWKRYDRGYMHPHKEADKQVRQGRTEPRRRYPLKFED